MGADQSAAGVAEDAVADVEVLSGGGRSGDVGQVRGDNLEDVLGVGEVLQPVLAEVAELETGGEPVAQELLGGQRDEHLPAVAGGLEAGAAAAARQPPAPENYCATNLTGSVLPTVPN